MKAFIAALTMLVATSTPVLAATGTIEIRPRATAVRGGQAAVVFLAVECTQQPNEVLLEGNVSVSQGAASGMAGLNPTCDGKTHIYPVRVTSFGGRFAAGTVFVSAFLLFLDESTQQTTSIAQSGTAEIR